MSFCVYHGSAKTSGKERRKSSFHFERTLIDVDQFFHFGAVAGVHFAEPNDLAQHFDVEAGAFGFGIYFADIAGKRLAFLFEALNALDK